MSEIVNKTARDSIPEANQPGTTERIDRKFNNTCIETEAEDSPLDVTISNQHSNTEKQDDSDKLPTSRDSSIFLF